MVTAMMATFYAATVRTLGWDKIVGLLLSVGLIASCTGATSEPVAEPEAPVARTADEWCAAGADRVIDRLEVFLADLPDVSVEDFLDLDDVEGLVSFQDSVARIISETTDQSSTLCDLDGLQGLVGERINDVERDGLLAEFLISSIRDGRELTTADLAVSPGDDVESVLGLLDDGSTLTFAAGTYELQRPLLVARAITLIGENVTTTTISSSSADAAIVVVGQGDLIMRDLRVEHVGTAAASVVLSFNRPVDLRDVHLAGGLADDQGGAGNGLVLTDETFGGTQSEPSEKPRSVVTSTVITNNAGAGIAVSGALQPRIEEVEISENSICGMCFFGTASGEVVNSSVQRNDFGIQIGDDAAPRITDNVISANATAGMVVLGTAAPVITANTFADNEQAAIAVQESAAPVITGNLLRSNPFGISVLSDGATQVIDNDIDGGEVGLQVDEQAMPLVRDNRLTGTLGVGIAVTGQAGGTYIDNNIAVGEGVGMVVDGEAAPVIDGLIVTGGEVAVAYTGSSAGSLANANLTGQDIGIQLDDQSFPQISNIVMVDMVSAGLVARGTVAATIRDVKITGTGEVGFAFADMTELTVERLEVVGGSTGGSIVGASTATVRASMFSDVEVGIQVGDQAAPTLQDNDVIRATSAGLVFVGESAGKAERNRIREPGIVGIQLGEMARPELDANVLFLSQPDDGSEAGPGDDEESSSEGVLEPSLGDAEGAVDTGLEASATVGILYAGETTGTASNNQIVGFVIGVQAGEFSMPEILDNVIDGGTLLGVGVLFRDDASGTARGNETSGHAVGFQVGDNATPLLDANIVVTASNVAFLVQGAASPVLTNNTCPDGLAGIGLLDGTDPERTNNSCIDVFGDN